MGIGKTLAANMAKIGQASGHCFSSNSIVTFTGEKGGLTGDPNQKLKITSPDGEFEFGHEDVETACVCCCGVVSEVSGKPIYGTKYRVILKDGKDFILTAFGSGAFAVEKTLF